MRFYEEITRTYENNVKIVYELTSIDTIFIHSIISKFPKCGNGSNAMESFINEFNDKTIYIYLSDELGTNKEILNKWYNDLGFIKIINNNLPYNVTHCIKAVL